MKRFPVPTPIRRKPPESAPSAVREGHRFRRTDGRFDLPVVTGRTPQEVARRLA